MGEDQLTIPAPPPGFVPEQSAAPAPPPGFVPEASAAAAPPPPPPGFVPERSVKLLGQDYAVQTPKQGPPTAMASAMQQSSPSTSTPLPDQDLTPDIGHGIAAVGKATLREALAGANAVDVAGRKLLGQHPINVNQGISTREGLLHSQQASEAAIQSPVVRAVEPIAAGLAAPIAATMVGGPVAGALAGGAQLAGGVADRSERALRQQNPGMSYEQIQGKVAGPAVAAGVLGTAVGMIPGAEGALGTVAHGAGTGIGFDLAAQGAEYAATGKPYEPMQTAAAGVLGAGMAGAAKGVSALFNARAPQQQPAAEQPAQAPTPQPKPDPAILEQEAQLDRLEPQLQQHAQEMQPAPPTPPPGFVPEAEATLQNFEAKSPAFEKAMEQNREARDIQQEHADAEASILPRKVENLQPGDRTPAADEINPARLAANRQAMARAVNEALIPKPPKGFVPEQSASEPPSSRPPMAGAPLEQQTRGTVPEVTEPEGAGRTPPPTEQTPQRPGGKEPWQLTRKEFYKRYQNQHTIIRDNPDEVHHEIQSNGFSRGVGPNLASITEGEPQNVIDRDYGTKAGQRTYAIPKEAVKQHGNGARVKDGHKPLPSESFVPARDFEPAHEAIVREAIQQGKPVPPQVLKEYPHLSFNESAPATPGGTAPESSVKGAEPPVAPPAPAAIGQYKVIPPGKGEDAYRLQKTDERGVILRHERIPEAVINAIGDRSDERMPNGYTKFENAVIRMMEMGKDERRAAVQKIEAARFATSDTPYWSDPEGNTVNGSNAYRNASGKKYWEPLNEAARRDKADIDRVRTPGRVNTPTDVQGKDLYIYARSHDGETRPVAGPFYTQHEAEQAGGEISRRLGEKFDTSRMEGFSYAAKEPGERVDVLYPDLRSPEGSSPFATRPAAIPSLPEPVPQQRFNPQYLADALPKQNVEGETPPGRMPVIQPSTQTPANETARPAESNAPSRKPVKLTKTRPFTKADLERKLTQHYDELNDQGAEYDRLQEESGGQGSAYTFHNQLPGEVKSFIESVPQARRLFKVTSNASDAHGADAMADLGDRYWIMAEDEASGRTRRAIEFGRKSPDPEMQLLAAIHDNMPAVKDRGPTEIRDPKEMPVGSKFELHGSKFEITEDADGLRLLKDGDEYPTVPAEAISKMPIDKGSFKPGEEPPMPEGDFAPPEPKPSAPTSDTGVFGQTIFRPATGSEQSPLFHEPVKVEAPTQEKIRGSANALNPKNTAEMFPAEKPKPAEPEPPHPAYTQSSASKNWGEEPPKPIDTSDMPIKVSPDDVSFETAMRAHSGTSMVPEDRGRYIQRTYVKDMRSAYDELAPLAKTPEQKAALAAEMERYKSGYLSRLNAWLGAKSRVVSSFIAGPSGFPARQMEKRGNTESKRMSELVEWDKRARAAMRKTIAPEESRVVSADNPNAPDILQKKLSQAERLQEIMVAANKIVRDSKLTPEQKAEKIQALGVSEKTARRVATEKDFAGRIGFADYELKNNNAEIKRLRGRIGEIQSTRAVPSAELGFDGGKIVSSAESNRVQILFDAKPDEAMRAKLKARGFRWAPSEGAWQRQRTGNALQAAKEIVGASGKFSEPVTDAALEAATQSGSAQDKPTPQPDEPLLSKAERDMLGAPLPEESSDHHVAVYGDKRVPIDYASDAKNEFRVAAQRVRDNLKTGEKGYVLTPDGKRYEISTDSKRAKLVTGDEPPATGKLDKLEAWGKNKLKKLGGPKLRSGVDPIEDPQRLAAYVAIGAAHVGRGVVKFAQWSAAMAEHVAGFTDAQVRKLFNVSRRVANMGEDERAVWTMRQYEKGGDYNAKTLIREMTGQVDTSRAVSEMKALNAGMRKAQAASKAGFQAGVDQLQGLKREFTRIIGENIPSSERFKLMGDVARIKTLPEMRLALAKASNVLADHNVRKSLASLEDLTGKLKIHVYRPPAAVASEGKAPRVPGDVDPSMLREVDLNKLPPEARAQIRPLLSEARLLKDRLRNAAAGASIEAKIAASDKFAEVEHQVRVIAANAMAEREIVVAGKVQQLHEAVKQTVDAIKAPPRSDASTGESPRERNQLKSAYRTQYNPDATIGMLAGEKGPAYEAGIRDIRRAQSHVYGEQQKYEKGLGEKLKAAGLDPKSAKYDKWLSTRETVKLPDAGNVQLTRPEMLDLYGHSQDQQTAGDIENGIGWNFESNRLGAPVKLSAADVAAIGETLTPAERALVDYHKQYVQDNLTEPAIRAKLAIDQRAPDPIEGYWPRARNLAARETEGLPSEWQAVQKKWVENIPSMKERGADGRTPILIRNAVEVMHDFVHDTAKLIHLAEPLHNAAAVLQHPDVRGAVERGYGPQINRQVKQYLLDTAGASQKTQRSRFDKIASLIQRNISRAWLTLNPSTWLKNALPGTVSLMPEFDAVDLQHGIKEASKPATFQRMLDTSPVAWNRYEGGGLYGQYSPLLEKQPIPSAQLSTAEAIKRGKIGAAIDAIPAMKRADAVPFTAAFAAAEHFIDRTQPSLKGDARIEAILEKFHEATYRTQNGNSSSEISYLASRARQSGPLAQALLMFQSDANKKLNQFGRWGNLDGKQRARLVAATGLGALMSAGITYGLKRTVTKIGQAVTGAKEDPDQLARDRHAAGWDIANNTLGLSYAGNVIIDWLRGAAHGDYTASNPMSAATSRFSEGMGRVLSAAYKAADADGGTAKADKARERLTDALLKAQDDVQTIGGSPLAPLTRLIERGFKAATFRPEDPRDTARKEKTAASRERRAALPAAVSDLLSEKDHLDAIGEKNLKPHERTRRGQLKMAEVWYTQMQKAEAAGKTQQADNYRKLLEREAEKRKR